MVREFSSQGRSGGSGWLKITFYLVWPRPMVYLPAETPSCVSNSLYKQVILYQMCCLGVEHLYSRARSLTPAFLLLLPIPKSKLKPQSKSINQLYGTKRASADYMRFFLFHVRLFGRLLSTVMSMIGSPTYAVYRLQ